MTLTTLQRINRLNTRIAELNCWREREQVAVDGWTCDGDPIEVGARWPATDGAVRFQSAATAPEHWSLADTRLILDLGGESLLTLTGEGVTAKSYGLDPNHQEFRVPSFSFSIVAESVARLPFGEPVKEPRINAARLAWIEPGIDILVLMLRQTVEAVETLGDHEVVPHLLEAAETAVRGLDIPSDTANYIARIAPAPRQQKIWKHPDVTPNPAGLDDDGRQSVERVFEQLSRAITELKVRFPQHGKILVSGHAHIDLAWLWPWHETRRKLRRTFHTALALLDKSSDFVFNQSTAAYYAQIEQDDPALLEAVRPYVESGRWETIGGMWVEPDTNMPTGESLARQILYGQRYFEHQFGKRHTVCWLPDCFGFSPALPQLLKLGGMEHFFTIKVNWSETNRFPYDLFWWEGLDGSRVLAHTFDNPMSGYNGFVQPDCFVPTWKNFRGKTAHDETLLAVGYGDGGGGVTPEMLEREKQLRDFPALPRARWGRVDEFFERARAGEPERGYPVWSGEMYLELHRATLTTQSHVKRLHRHAERALITAETLASFDTLLGGEQPDSLEPLWRMVLKNEFHDILPGSCIREAAEDAESELGEVVERGLAAQRDAMRSIAARLPEGNIDDAMVLANPAMSERAIDVVLKDGTFISTEDTVPALGIAVVSRARLRPAPGLSVAGRTLENANLKVTIGPDGAIESLIHKATGRETFDGRGNQLWAYPIDKPRYWDAWDIEEDYAERGEEVVDVDSMEVVDEGPHRAAIRVVKKWRNSTVEQTYALTANARRLDIETVIDWHDRRSLLRTVNPVAVRSRDAVFECAHGVIRRATHMNTSWEQAQFEVPGHRFADMSEPGFGVALLNDAKYGHSAKANVLGLSLVRGAVWPDPIADEGRQALTYAIMPHAGEWYEGGVREEAEALNQPLLALAATGLAEHGASLIACEGVGAALSALKPAEDGAGLVLRIYEPAGGRGAFGLSLPEGWAASGPLNLLEETMQRDEPHDLMPFEVRSWRLQRG
jgi:alpha-mannosidase